MVFILHKIGDPKIHPTRFHRMMNKVMTKFSTGQEKVGSVLKMPPVKRNYNRKQARKANNNKADLDLDGRKHFPVQRGQNKLDT